MMNRTVICKVAILFASAVALASSSAIAAIPSATQIEGALTAVGGGPVSDGDYAMTFLLYKDAQGGSAAWSEGPINVTVKSGSFSHDLGTSTPLSQDVLKALAGQGFLAMKIANDPELPRKPLRSAMFALRASAAETLDCSGCITAAHLDAGILQPYAKTASLATVATTGKFSDLQGGPDLSAYAKIASLADVASTGAYADLKGTPDTSVFAKVASLAAIATSGKYSDLTGAPTLAKLDATCGTGLVIKGLKADGSYECVQSMDPTGLPADAIDEVSNGLIWNQFTDVFSSAAALPIPDNNPIGGFSEIVVGDVGLAQKLTVSVELANSDISAVQVSLYDSANQEYVLYNKGGKKGDGIKTSYPTPTKTVSGDLTYWVGKNPKGTWRLKVIDTAFLNNTTDGQVVAWSVNLQTLSSKKIQIKGDLIVDGATYIKGDLKVDGKVTTVDSTTVKPVVYRWINFSTYGENQGDWFMSNRTDVYGGVNPSTWTDGNACASNISSSREVQRSFFTRKGYGGYNANVWTEEWKSYSSTNSHKAAVLFRIKNTTANAIAWNVYTYQTAWVDQDRASVSVNGANTWCPGSNYYASDANNFSLSIPGNRTSTVIFVAGSTPQWNDLRACILAFWNNSLALPAGLEYVDDLDTAKDGWDQ